MPRLSPRRGDNLGWTHFKALIYIGDPLQHDFYLQIAAVTATGELANS